MCLICSKYVYCVFVWSYIFSYDVPNSLFPTLNDVLLVWVLSLAPVGWRWILYKEFSKHSDSLPIVLNLWISLKGPPQAHQIGQTVCIYAEPSFHFRPTWPKHSGPKWCCCVIRYRVPGSQERELFDWPAGRNRTTSFLVSFDSISAETCLCLGLRCAYA